MLPFDVILALEAIRKKDKLSPRDAALIFLYADEEPFKQYLDICEQFITNFYNARKFFRTQVKSKLSDHKNAIKNPGGWAGPAMLSVLMMLLARPIRLNECFIGAGIFKGGSTACIAPICDHLNIEYVAADTFCGLPFGEEGYNKAEFYGTLDEVKENMSHIYQRENITYLKGLFSETLKNIQKDVAGIFLDTDLYDSSYSALFSIKKNINENTIFFSDGISPYRDFKNGVFSPQTPEARAIKDFFDYAKYNYTCSHTHTGNLAIFQHEKSTTEHFDCSFYSFFCSLLTLRMLGAKSAYPFKKCIAAESAYKNLNIQNSLLLELCRQVSYKNFG